MRNHNINFASSTPNSASNTNLFFRFKPKIRCKLDDRLDKSVAIGNR